MKHTKLKSIYSQSISRYNEFTFIYHDFTAFVTFVKLSFRKEGNIFWMKSLEAGGIEKEHFTQASNNRSQTLQFLFVFFFTINMETTVFMQQHRYLRKIIQWWGKYNISPYDMKSKSLSSKIVRLMGEYHRHKIPFC